MFRTFFASALLGALTLLSVDFPAHAASRTAASGKNLYIVVLRDAPLAARKSAGVSRRAVDVAARHDSMLATVGGARKIYSYSHALNGFAAELSEVQVTKLRSDPNVISVVRNEIRKLNTLTTPAFLGLSAPNGVWDRLGGGGAAGDNVIVGVIDTGIWPESPSFVPRAIHGGRPPQWNGICQAGEQFPADSCNNKLLGARYYNEGFGGNDAVRSLFPYEFISPRAADGHGVHTASTAVGNYQVNAESGGVKLGRISGMAPGARLAVYKACWGYEDDPGAGCATVDSVAAIDQAVADGVDVINFSVGGSLTSFIDPIEFAFLLAADAGVFVATSAGNEGRQGASTVAHISPWVTSVGIATHDRRYEAAAIFESGARFNGSSLDDRGLSNHRIVLAANARLPGQDAALAALCLPGTLNPALANDKIVVCDRGENARVEKSHVVNDAGGVGMILVNPTPNTLNADIHAVPTVHLDDVAGAAFKRYLASHPAVKARLTPGNIVTGPAVRAPNLGADSSRGPALAGGGDILKPDLLAPGLEILAAYSPVRTGLDFEFLGGSSMSSAFIAGIGALMKHAHPDWSPAMIKSALMTTATVHRNDGKKIREDENLEVRPTPFGIGAGMVQPNAALDPGLVYDAGLNDWLGFLCGVGEACFPPIEAIDPSDLNHPSIAIGHFVGQQTIQRTVTNVAQHASRYTVSVEAPAGISVSVSPRRFTIAPGETQTYKVTFARNGAYLASYAFGALTWSDGQHQVRSPIAIQPAPLGAPAELFGAGAQIKYSVDFGYSGPFKASARGLIPAKKNKLTVRDDPANEVNTALATGRGVVIVPIDVAAGATYARFSLFDTETDGNDDLDLYVFNSNGDFVAGSTGNTANEEVNLIDPAPDRYLVVVHGFETDGFKANFTLFSWALGNVPAGNMIVTATTKAQINHEATIALAFSKLKAGVKYLGSVAYQGAAGMPNPTIVRVDR